MSAGPEIAQATILKPKGVNWLGVLATLCGVMLLYSGVELAQDLGTSSSLGDLFGFAFALYLGYGILATSVPAIFILAIVFLVTATSLFLSKRWAWHLSLTLTILGIGLNIAQIALFLAIGWLGWLSLVIALLIPYYLTRPRVRGFFQSQTKSLAE